MGKGNLHALVGMQICAATVENSMEFPQKIKNRTTLCPSDSERSQNTNSEEYMHPCVHCGVIYNRQAMEAAQVPTSIGVGKEVVHIYNGLSLVH